MLRGSVSSISTSSASSSLLRQSAALRYIQHSNGITPISISYAYNAIRAQNSISKLASSTPSLSRKPHARGQHLQSTHSSTRSLPNYPECINQLPDEFITTLRPKKTPKKPQPSASDPSPSHQSPIEGADDAATISSINDLEAALKNLASADTLNASVISIPVSVDEYEKPHKDLPTPEEARADLPKSISFNTVKRAFVIKSDYELIRSLIVFRLCAWPWLVANARTLLNISYKVLGHTITNFILKRTFFAHFCAGEDGDEIKPVIQRLESSGVGAILDYAAEADVAANNPDAPASSTDDLPDRREGVVSARTYEYTGEEECDANAKICLACIEDAGRRADGFAAIKLTALGKPELLQHLSNVLMDTKRLFATFLAQQQKGSFDKKIPKIDMNTKISYSDFHRGLKAINVNLSEKIGKRLFKRIDSNQSGDIDYLEWISFLDPRLLGGLNPTLKLRKDENQNHAITTLNEEEMKQLNNMIVRLEILAERAAQRGVRLMVDAEQTYFQPAIDHLVLGLQRKYNKETPLIYNTYQCYLKDAHSRLLVDIERAKREGFLFAAKLVRGAYMVQERKRAHELDIEDPICEDIGHTHAMYHKCVDIMLDNIDIADVMIASHNEKSVQYVEKRMRDVGIPAKGGGVFFGQLLGMCDHVSFTLGVMGFSVYKYVPYGKIEEVIPYLLRRAEENSNLLGSATKERQLIFRELLRRRLPFVLDYVNRVKPIAA